MKSKTIQDNPGVFQNPQVLVVGAGPSGLILCHELLRRGIKCRLIEKRSHPSGSTRAFTLHARTMEMFDHMGLASRIDELREVCPGNRFHFPELSLGSNQSPVLDFGRLPGTRYNYYGKVNQNDLDRALRESLAANYDFHPEYGVEYIESEQEADLVRVKVQRGGKEGEVEEIVVPWVVGADGSRSTVRSTLGLAFEQREGNSMTMSMVDAYVDGFNGDRSWVNYYVSAKGFLLLTGLPGGKYRIYLAGDLENFLKEGTPQEAFQRALDSFDTGANITAMDWSSTWEIRKIVGETYMLGRILLCGDATHVHSPAGGQGMNACMQDAFNLGWKLALMIQKRSPHNVLESYATERRPIAEQVTAGADRMHQILFNASIPVADRFKLTQDPNWHDEAIMRISALSHNYRGVDGVVADLDLAEGVPLPGDRAPDCILSDEPPRMRLYDSTRHPGFTLLWLCEPVAEAKEKYVALTQTLQKKYGRLVKSVHITSAHAEGINPDEIIVDRSQKIQLAYGGDKNQMILVRPDLYVGFRGSHEASESLFDYLNKWILPLDSQISSAL